MSEQLLATVVDVIVELCHPDEVVLFGSRAEGPTHAHSDIDLLVVGPFRDSRWLRDRELREVFRDFPIPIDLHMLTAQELEDGSRVAHSYLNTALATSRTLYRRTSDEPVAPAGREA